MTENIVTLLGIVLLIIVKFSEKKTETKDTNVLSACHLGIMVVIMVVIILSLLKWWLLIDTSQTQP